MMFVTPEKGNLDKTETNYASEHKKSSPESLFTPLRIPGTTRFDTY